MSKENKIIKFVRGLVRPKLLMALGTLILCGVFFYTAPFNASATPEDSWGPRDRATFTWAEPADYITFNSITDNPQIGDERNFVRIREADSDDDYSDSVTLEPGKEYEVWIWFHNNAKAKLNKREYDGVGLAHNVRLRMEQPGILEADKYGIIRGTISSTNSDPAEVWDEAFVYTDAPIGMRFVPNSATIHSLGDINGQILTSEALFGEEGAKLGYYNEYWGTLPGCNEFAGYVTYRFKVDQPDFEISKTVTKDGDDNYVEYLTANPGDILQFKLDYRNTGTTNQLDITGHDHLPDGLEYIEGSTYFSANFNPEGNTYSEGLFDRGVNLGDFKPGDSMSLTYKVRVTDDVNIFPCGDTKVYNDASIATANGTGHDRAEITVHRTCDCVTNPEMEGCQELPHTGPVEVAIATLIVGGIGGAGYYLYATRRTLKAVQSGVTGASHKGTNSHSLHGNIEAQEPIIPAHEHNVSAQHHHKPQDHSEHNKQ